MRRALVLVLGTALGLSASGMAMAAKPAVKAAVKTATMADPTVRQPGWVTPRNAMGQPDLSGYWSNASLTPLTRSRNITDKSSLTAAEAHKLEVVFTKALEDSDKPTD